MYMYKCFAYILESLKMDLRVVLIYHVDAGNQTQVPHKSSKFAKLLSHLSSPPAPVFILCI